MKTENIISSNLKYGINKLYLELIKQVNKNQNEIVEDMNLFFINNNLINEKGDILYIHQPEFSKFLNFKLLSREKYFGILYYFYKEYNLDINKVFDF